MLSKHPHTLSIYLYIYLSIYLKIFLSLIVRYGHDGPLTFTPANKAPNRNVISVNTLVSSTH